MADEINRENAKLATGFAAYIYPSMKNTMMDNPWSETADILTAIDFIGTDYDKQRKVIENCRFYFRHDPLVNTVITKIVDFSINDLIVSTEKASPVESSIFEALSLDIVKFLRNAAFEFLITGMIVPEIKLTLLSKNNLIDKNIKYIDSILYPTSMWLRDAKDVEIKKPWITEKESYFLIIPDEVINFITNKGNYGNSDEQDTDLYKEIVRLYPEFVNQVLSGKRKVLLDNPLIIKGTTLADSPYPIPYLFPALEPLRHKRNLRRMDYSIAARVISAILLVRMGSDDFPLTEDQEDELTALEDQFKWRQTLSVSDLERVFALFSNHTVQIDWIFPEMDALLNNDKYQTVNQDIMVALGFPRILITGETERSFASDPQIATLSPINTMNQLRTALLPIAKKIFIEMKKQNSIIKNLPDIRFKPINLMSLQLFYDGLKNLNDKLIISDESYAEAYGFDILTQLEQAEKLEKIRKDRGLPPFREVPHSNEPGRPTGSNPPETTK